MNDQEEAKKIFFDYACSGYLMYNDGVDSKYKRFGISKAQEDEWYQEYISFWVSQLSTDNLKVVDRLRDANAREALPDLIKMAGQGDSYAKLWYANAIRKLASQGKISATLEEQAKKTMIDLWQSLVQGPIELSEEHRAEITPSAMKSLGASTPEEYVSNYAKHLLTRAQTKEDL